MPLAVRRRERAMRAWTPAATAWWGRMYFAVQAVGGALWWVAVFTSTLVRESTLGGLDPIAVAIVDIPFFVVASALAAGGVRFAATVATAWTLLVTTSLAIYATITTEAGWGVLAMMAASLGSALAWCFVRFGRLPREWVAVGPFAFRLADERATPVKHLGTTALQIVVFWGLFLVVIPTGIVALESRWGLAIPDSPVASALGWIVVVFASALGIWAAVSMSMLGGGTPLPAAMANRLVVVGPYRYVRNPMAIAGIAQGVAVGLIASTWLVVVYALAGSLLWNYIVRPLEEADLEARFGDDFRDCRGRVRCWVPRIPCPAKTV